MSIQFNINDEGYVARFFAFLEATYGPAIGEEVRREREEDEIMQHLVEQEADLPAQLSIPCSLSCYTCATLGCTHQCTACFVNSSCTCLCQQIPEQSQAPIIDQLADDEADFLAYARRLPRDLFSAFEIVEYGNQEMELDQTML